MLFKILLATWLQCSPLGIAPVSTRFHTVVLKLVRTALLWSCFVIATQTKNLSSSFSIAQLLSSLDFMSKRLSQCGLVNKRMSLEGMVASLVFVLRFTACLRIHRWANERMIVTKPQMQSSVCPLWQLGQVMLCQFLSLTFLSVFCRMYVLLIIYMCNGQHVNVERKCILIIILDFYPAKDLLVGSMFLRLIAHFMRNLLFFDTAVLELCILLCQCWVVRIGRESLMVI